MMISMTHMKTIAMMAASRIINHSGIFFTDGARTEEESFPWPVSFVPGLSRADADISSTG